MSDFAPSDLLPDLAGHVRRFVRGFRGALSPAELHTARELLGPAEWELFAALQGRERRHALDIVLWLRTHAAPSDELLRAALVHNVGKGPLHLHERVIYVLLERLSPRLLRRLADPDGRGLRSALVRLREHAGRSAERLAEAGSSARVQALVRQHHDAPAGGDRELAWLIEADRRR